MPSPRFLGDLPTQFREVQGSESNEFLQLFKNGVQYADGGVDSAFTKVDRDAYTTRLLHVKGTRNVRCMQVPVDVASLNNGDVFILDTGKILYQWNGPEASRQEKAKALDVTLAIRSEEHGGKSQIVALDVGTPFSVIRDFFAALGCDDVAGVAIKSAEEGGDDDKVVGTAGGAVKLYRASDESGELSVTEIAERPLSRDALKTEDVFILVAGGIVYAWVGKKASPGERKGAMATAVKFIEANGLPPNAPVKIVKEGTEPALFRQAFHQWNKPATPAAGSAPGAKKPERRARAEVDAAALAAGRGPRDDDATRMIDDGGGDLHIWRVENFAREPVDPARYGQFYAGDSYVLQYTYDGGKQHVIYFWQGRDSTADEKGASALLAKELDDSLGGQAAQVRVVMGKEPGHFHRLFKGRMVVHSGGKAGSFKNRAEEDTYDDDGVALFHVRGTSDLDTRAVQVADDAACLNSGDCFVLRLHGTVTGAAGRVIAWEGRGASDDEKRCAKTIAETLAPDVGVTPADVEVVAEGDEPAEFWSAVGGKKAYAEFAEGEAPPQDPRLFQICDAAAGGSGVACEEIFNFCQDDLVDEDVMLLDVVAEVFLWVGSQANENEKREARVLASKYVAACAETDGRDVDTPVTSVAAGAEPPMFTCHFIGWDASKAGKGFVDPYEAKLAAARAANPPSASPDAELRPKLRKTPTKEQDQQQQQPTAAAAAAATASPTPVKVGAPSPASGASVDVTAAPGSKVIAYAELQTMDASAGIDMTRKESYLSDAEFTKVFGVTKEAFGDMALWKKQAAKKKVGLF